MNNAILEKAIMVTDIHNILEEALEAAWAG